MATYSAVKYGSFLTIKQAYMIKPYGQEQFSDYIRTAHVYKIYIGIGTPILNPAGNEIMIYEGKTNTDKWYPVRLLDAGDSTFPRTGVAVGSVTVTYGFESAVAETPYAIVGADWKEQGNGNYWLNMGAGEFANEGKYTVKVRTYPIANDLVFIVEVRDLTGAETINLISQLAQSEYADCNLIKATVAVPAQGITPGMAASGCIQYEEIKVSFTKNFAAPDFTYYQLWRYDALGDVVERKPSLGTVW